MKARILSVVLLLLWGMQYMLPSAWYVYKRSKLHEAYSQSEALKQASSFQTIKFKDGELIQWERNRKEVIYQDKIYEVINIRKSNGTTLLTCLLDEDETKILGIYDSLSKEQKSIAFKVFKHKKVVPLDNNSFETDAVNDLLLTTKEFMPEPPDKWRMDGFKVPDPPPEMVFKS